MRALRRKMNTFQATNFTVIEIKCIKNPPSHS